MLDAATAPSSVALPCGPLVRPQLAKRASYATGQQKPHRPAAVRGGALRPAITTLDRTAAANGGANMATAAAQGEAAPHLARKPSLSRNAFVATAADTDAAASVASTGEPAASAVPGVSTLPPLNHAAKPTFMRRKPAAGKPGAVKRQKAPALLMIVEDAASPATVAEGRSSAQLTGMAPDIDRGRLHAAAPGMHTANAEPPLTAETAVAKPTARQRFKAADLDTDAVHTKVLQMHAEGKLADLKLLTVPEAKCWLKSRKLKLTGKKDELMARIAENMLQP